MVIIVINIITAGGARYRSPATERGCLLKSVLVRDRLYVAFGSEGDGFGGGAQRTASTICLYITFVIGVGFQSSKGERLGSDIHRSVERVDSLAVTKLPGCLTATGGPIQCGGVSGDVGGGKLEWNLATGLRHSHIVHIPRVIGIVGVMTESDMGIGRRSCKVFGFQKISVGSPVIIAVGINHHKGGGIRQVGHIAYVKGSTAAGIIVCRSGPEGELQIADGLVKCRKRNDPGIVDTGE